MLIIDFQKNNTIYFVEKQFKETIYTYERKTEKLLSDCYCSIISFHFFYHYLFKNYYFF